MLNWKYFLFVDRFETTFQNIKDFHIFHLLNFFFFFTSLESSFESLEFVFFSGLLLVYISADCFGSATQEGQYRK